MGDVIDTHADKKPDCPYLSHLAEQKKTHPLKLLNLMKMLCSSINFYEPE